MARLPITRILMLAALWWVLTGGDPGGWLFGVPVVAVAALASFKLVPARTRRWSPAAAPGFALFFVRKSVMGGIDVAMRALHPRLPLNPAFIDYRLRLDHEPARVFFSGALSLLPGTLSVELRPGAVTIHVLDRNMATRESLRRLEEHVARLFGLHRQAG